MKFALGLLSVAHVLGQALPECQPSQCGSAISWDRSGTGRPLCLCNPLCETMKGTPGVLPCCPKLQEVCLDPWRSPSPAPAQQFASVAQTLPPALPQVQPARTASPACVTVQHGPGGDGFTFPKAGDTVTMHYVGTLTNGQKFDSSRDRGQPFSTQIGVGEVIRGWDQGVPQLSLGESATLRISSACGYGAQGSPPVIPGGADLVFEVELISINGISKSVSAILPAAISLPTCKRSSCGMGMSASSSSRVAVCACDVSCLAPGSSLPCCNSYREVCLASQTVAPATRTGAGKGKAASANLSGSVACRSNPGLPGCMQFWPN